MIQIIVKASNWGNKNAVEGVLIGLMIVNAYQNIKPECECFMITVFFTCVEFWYIVHTTWLLKSRMWIDIVKKIGLLKSTDSEMPEDGRCSLRTYTYI